MNFDDLRRAVTSEWLKLALLLVAVVGGWYKFDYRISAMEKLTMQHEQEFSQIRPILEKLDKTLDRVDQTLGDFPPHRHVNDDDVIYPGDTMIRNGTGRAKH